MVKQLAFIVVFIVANVLFVLNLAKFVRVAALGRPAHLKETWGQRIGSLLKFFFGQRKVMEEKSSLHHLAIYWGFLVITVISAEMFLAGMLGDWFDFGVLLGERAYGVLLLVVDISTAFVVAALTWAFIRRLFVRPAFIPANADAMLILGAIMTLMLTHYGHHAWRMAAEGAIDPNLPVSAMAGRLTGVYALDGGVFSTSFDAGWAHIASEAHWWAHVLILLGFLNYLPFSKHIHVLGSGPNILMRNQQPGQRGAMPKRELFDGGLDDPDAEPLFGNWGVGKIESFSWKSLMDNYACTECARCTIYCPAFATNKPLSPMHLIHDLKDEMKDRGFKLLQLRGLGKSAGVDVQAPAPGTPEEEPDSEQAEAWSQAQADPSRKPTMDRIEAIKQELAGKPPLVGGRIKDETLWACTTCGACMEVCPVFIDHPLKILEMRTHIVLNDEGGRTPGELTRTFNNLERAGNPWGIAAENRMAWAKDLEVPTLADRPNAEYLLFVGCAGAYSDISQKATRALVRCLEAAGVEYAVMGNDEGCTGDPARRAGNEMLFQTMAKANVDAMNEAKVRKVIASCPHCFHTIRNEYPQFGGNYEVIHHSQLLAHLLDSGRLKVDKPLAGKATYHDSCYLGRWNSVYDEPRSAVAAVLDKAGTLVELERRREHGFCCGAGGGRMWMEEEPEKRVNVNRAQEIVATKAETVAVACPFCKTMVTDGVKHLGQGESMTVLDVAEIVAAGLSSAPAAAPAQAAVAQPTGDAP